MGLFSFVKEAGATVAAQSAAIDAHARNAELANALVANVKALGFDVENVGVVVSGDSVTVTGNAASQGEKEKIILAIGNSKGVASVDDQLTVAAPAPASTFHTVAKGETLSKIAKEHYGEASQYKVIFEANRPMLKDPDHIYPGQVLRIPAVSA